MTAPPALAQVAVDLAVAETDKLYTYTVPPELTPHLTPGCWVEVPFGAQRRVGCYIGPAAAGPAGVQLKPLCRVAAEIPPLPPPLIALARWVAERYLCPFAAALRLLLPAAARRQQVRALEMTGLRLAVPPTAALEAAAAAEKRAPVRARLLRTLAAAAPEPVELVELARLGGGARAALHTAVEAGLVERVTLTRRRDPFAGRAAVPDAPPPPTPDQAAAQAALDEALARAAAGEPVPPVLLHGVTGSGKTEVYLGAIAAALAEGRQAIMLVPEISLTPQMVHRFRARFGDRVAVLHSALSDGEKFDEWVRIRRGDVSVAIGARSAVFAPFTRVGIIIVDEEHESTYKQDGQAPSYHAREVAEERARREGALLVLGSATPALETFWRAEHGRIRYLRLPRRIDDRPLPPVTLVDMRAELRGFNRSVFSRPLQAALAETLAAGEQAILFLNRRGFNTFVLCRACGEAVQCPHCAVTLTYHLPGAGRPAPRRLECHYCGHQAPVPETCPHCGSKQIRYLGAGTERVEEELRALLPGARTLRMDVDTTRRKGSHAGIVEAFDRGEADVLIGTQMVAKGLDFGRVTLVGVILADVTLNLPDFRSAERTFQLVTQVAGRAGRGDRPGRVLVQTYNPDHFAIVAAAGHDYELFYRQQILLRQSMGYPPYAELIRLVFTGPEQAEVQAAAAHVHRLLRDGFPGELLDPTPAPLARLRGMYRHHVILKGTDRPAMAGALRSAFQADAGRWRRGRKVRLILDVGPHSIL